MDEEMCSGKQSVGGIWVYKTKVCSDGLRYKVLHNNMGMII